jgi:hypothetical protein
LRDHHEREAEAVFASTDAQVWQQLFVSISFCCFLPRSAGQLIQTAIFRKFGILQRPITVFRLLSDRRIQCSDRPRRHRSVYPPHAQLVSGDVAARKAYLASIVDAVIVPDDKIRIIGSNDNIRSTFGPRVHAPGS